MEIKIVDSKPKLITRPATTQKEKRGMVRESAPLHPVFNEIGEEVGTDVVQYLNKFKITKSQHVLFLSHVRHYIYDSEQLAQVDTLINFKSLNRIPHLWYFLSTMNRILPLNGYFVGSFVEYGTQRERMIKSKHSLLGQFFLFLFRAANRIIPRIPLLNTLQRGINHGKVKCITREEAKVLLEKSGFKVVDMTEIDGITFFITLKVEQANQKEVSLWSLLNYFRTKSHVINI